MQRQKSVMAVAALIAPLLTLGACSANSAGQREASNTAAPSTDGTSQATHDVQQSSTARGAPMIDGQITLPEGFSLSKFHDGLGDTMRHIAIAPNGDLFAAMRNGRIIAARDTDQDGRADKIEERKLDVTTGIEVFRGWLYYSDRVSVSRIKLDDVLMPTGAPEIVVSGFARERQHADKTFAFDGDGNIYVNIGAPSNACQVEMRTPGSPGMVPCPQLDQHAGVWKFPGERIGMSPADGTRYLTGARNTMAMEWSAQNDGFFAVTHGRDQLATLFPDLYTDEQSAELPAEEVHLIRQGADLGWPYTYYDPLQGRRIVAPEYGGDGVRTPDIQYQEPIWAAPAHWAPNDLTLIDNRAFAAPFNEGVLIAFHGSWNRAPLPQAGYRLSFLPTTDGKVSGELMNFAVGFPLKNPLESPSDAEHRPIGLAIGPDGSIYVADSIKGTVFRIAKAER